MLPTRAAPTRAAASAFEIAFALAYQGHPDPFRSQESRGVLYLSYLERVDFFLEGFQDAERTSGLGAAEKARGEKLRSALRVAANQGLVLGAMKWAASQGCTRLLIWSCPPKKGKTPGP